MAGSRARLARRRDAREREAIATATIAALTPPEEGDEVFSGGVRGSTTLQVRPKMSSESFKRFRDAIIRQLADYDAATLEFDFGAPDDTTSPAPPR